MQFYDQVTATAGYMV